MNTRILATALSVAIASTGGAAAEPLSSLKESACLANGIDKEKCICIFDTVAERHGEQSARYVALDMSLRYDDAAALLETIGEDAASAAGNTFDLAQNKDCSAGRRARLDGTYTASSDGSGAVSGAMSASASDMAGEGSVVEQNEVAHLDVPTLGGQVFDLRSIQGRVVSDVSVEIAPDFALFSRTSNFRNYVGLYEVVDENGGVDTNGDGAANVRPGDEDYARTAQARVIQPKLYLSESAGKQQYLGEVHLDGGRMYAPLVYLNPGSRTADQISAAMNTGSIEDFIMGGLRNPTNLFFVFDAANPEGEKHLASTASNAFGFEDLPSDVVGGDSDFNDVVFVFDFAVL